jgi:hypothetical protein
MKLAGDVPKEVQDQADQLSDFEKLVDGDPYSHERKAQLYVMLAHDWFMMDMEEEGERLLYKARGICPGYFAGAMIQHQVENANFATIVKNLTGELRSLLLDTLRNK